LTNQKTYTYSEVRLLSRRLAAGLVDCGFGAGDHIGIILGNYPEFAIVKFAIAYMGAVAVPINYLLRREELRYIIEQADLAALITMDLFRDRDYLADLDALAPGWETNRQSVFAKLRRIFVYSTTDSRRAGICSFESIFATGDVSTCIAIHKQDSICDPHQTSDIIYTSGTTGLPKGVILSHDMVLRTAYASAYTRAFEDGRRIIFASPMYHVLAYVECFIACMYVGGAIVPQVIFSAEDMLTAVERHRASEIISIPFMGLRLLEVARGRGFDSSSVLAVFNSAGVSPPTIWGEFRSVLGAAEVTTGYGMTETTASTACSLPEEDDRFLLETNGRLKQAGIAGDAALGGVLARYKAVDSETSDDLPWGTLGELLVQGPIVTKGYYKKPDETRYALQEDGWLHTGDLGTIDADGNVCLRGRLKEAYRCGGEMVMPREVEEILSKHPMVAEALVVGVPDKKMGEVGCACVIPAPNVEFKGDDLVDFCRQQLARFKVPLYILRINREDVFLTATGRPQKLRLREFAIKRLEDIRSSSTDLSSTM
jgi:fatty-acyl-CoA synthase